MSTSTYSNYGTLVRRADPWYRNATFLWLLKSTTINFILPFFNGVMLGFGEIFSNEVLFRYGWFGYTRPTIGVYGGIPPSATAEYKKTIQNEIKREHKQEQEKLLLLD